MASPTPADVVTLASLVLGVFAGHLFWYRSAWVNAAGVLLFIASDILDSVDGQLARLRGTSTRMGRILDGLADAGRCGDARESGAGCLCGSPVLVSQCVGQCGRRVAVHCIRHPGQRGRPTRATARHVDPYGPDPRWPRR